MAAPMTDILFPEDSALSRLIIAETTCGVGIGVVTLTLSASYPPIDRSLPNPVLAILLVQNDATLVATGSEQFPITGAMVAGIAPDSIGEFLVTADRTINVYRSAAETTIALIAYISKGSGNKV